MAEAIGTFFLVLIGPGAAMVNAHTNGVITHPGVALSFAFVVCAMVYTLGHVSGAHINPAVTIAFWTGRRFPGRDVLPYIVSQCIGASAAAFVLRAMLGGVSRAAATIPAISIGGAFAIEWLLSFVLMLVIMAVATDERVAEGFAGIAVGFTVGMDALMGGPLTGASMNPARSFGPALSAGVWDAHWIYWVAPITGTIAAVYAYDRLRRASAPQADLAFGVEGPLLESQSIDAMNAPGSAQASFRGQSVRDGE